MCFGNSAGHCQRFALLRPYATPNPGLAGMTPRQVLWRVELPNAVPIIMGGVRVALAINVGTAPLAFLIGANSLGSLIFPGIALNNQPHLILGAACTALLALLLDGLVIFISRRWLERGLRPA